MKLNCKIYLKRIVLFYLLIPIVIAIGLYPLLPMILNYPPDSINNQFQLDIDGITYSQQYIMLVFLVLSISFIILFIRIFKINKSISILEAPDRKLSKVDTSNLLIKIRSFCLNTPYLLYFLEIIVPLILLPLTFILIKAYEITIIKICLIYLSLFTLASVISLVFSKNEFRHILTLLHENYPELMNIIELKYSTFPRKRIKGLPSKMFLQLFPLILVSLIFTSLVGYIQSSKKTGDIYYQSYSSLLDNTFNRQFSSSKDIDETLQNLELLDSSHIYFILDNSGNYTTSNNSVLQPFFIKYTIEKSYLQNKRTYDYYCLDTQGISTQCYTSDGNLYYVGFVYDISQPQFLTFILFSDIILFFIILVILLYVSISLSKDIKVVTNKLNEIASDNKNNINLNSNLAITSDDEIADLIIAFNTTQKLIKNNVEQIHKNQEKLMESERLSSLGQLVGGIAHNLKTPIMSISGASEGISDLIKEYEAAIDDPDVNSQDHHEIAQEMAKWIGKIKKYTEYMSDVITAVKGQTVNLSETENISFDLEELIKRVDILMKHELKNAIVYLNINIDTPKNTVLHGDINSLVQVINNMISNSIQSYNGKPEQNIDLIITKENTNIIISIKDYGCGLSDKVKNKLFKEMITTKGKNGTGLGLYMSYSTIKANFSGDITFESEEGKGTTFHIILPL